MKPRAVLVFLLLLSIHTPSGFGVNPAVGDEEIALHWDELAPFLAGRNVVGGGSAMLVLPDGAVVQGRIHAVEEDAIVLDVSKSSDKRAYPKRRTSIPRGSVSTIRLTRDRGASGRIIGTVAGILGGAALGTLFALENDNPSGAARAGVLALWVGTGVGGYYVGRAFDRENITVKIVK